MKRYKNFFPKHLHMCRFSRCFDSRKCFLIFNENLRKKAIYGNDTWGAYLMSLCKIIF